MNHYKQLALYLYFRAGLAYELKEIYPENASLLGPQALGFKNEAEYAHYLSTKE